MVFEIYCDKSHFFCEKCVRHYLKESCDKQYREVGLYDIDGIIKNINNIDIDSINVFNEKFSNFLRYHKIIKLKKLLIENKKI